jgi:hypothetical protein
VYVREDHILAALPARLATLNIDPAPAGRKAGRAKQPTRLAQALRTHGLVIVCATTGWTVQPDPHITIRSSDLMIA